MLRQFVIQTSRRLNMFLHTRPNLKEGRYHVRRKPVHL